MLTYFKLCMDARYVNNFPNNTKEGIITKNCVIKMFAGNVKLYFKSHHCKL